MHTHTHTHTVTGVHRRIRPVWCALVTAELLTWTRVQVRDLRLAGEEGPDEATAQRESSRAGKTPHKSRVSVSVSVSVCVHLSVSLFVRALFVCFCLRVCVGLSVCVRLRCTARRAHNTAAARLCGY